jgi:ubiquinone/menaquinone biosynthesis C-methylase UbiE
MAGDNRTYYDAFSKDYERHRHAGYHAFVDDMEAEIARPYVQGREVLDAGCGTGLISERLGRLARRVVGCDLSAEMLGHARARGFEVVQGDLRWLPFPDECFDSVVCFKVLAHLRNPSRVVEELGRVVKPGGHLVLEFYNKRSLRYVIRRVRPSLRTSSEFRESQIHTAFHSPAEVAALFPPQFKLQELRGIRGFTVVPEALRLPVLGPLMLNAERHFTFSPVSKYGGFLVAIARKQ